MVPDLNARYKTGTKHVVQWLANAALQHGQERHVFSILPALEDASAKLSTQNLVDLSKLLVQGAAMDKLPPEGIGDAILVLGDVIAGRRECADWYSQKPTTSSSGSSSSSSATREDQTHKHFIGVLQHVLQHLKDTVRNSRLPENTTTTTNREQDGISPRRKLVNVYQALFVEEPQVEIPSSTARKKKLKPPRLPVKVELESDGAAEKDFELWCFLRECYNIRLFVRDTWLSQQRGETSVDIASQVTTSALWLLNVSAEELTSLFPDFSDFGNVARYLEIESVSSGSNLESFKCNHSGLRRDSVGCDEGGSPDPSDLLCVRAFTGLSLLKHSLAECTNSSTNVFDTILHLRATHPLFEDILRSLPEITTLGKDITEHPEIAHADPFTALVARYLQDLPDEFSLSLVMAFQLHMDLHEAVENKTRDDYSRMKTIFEIITTDFARYHKAALGVPHVYRLEKDFLRSDERDEISQSISRYKNALQSTITGMRRPSALYERFPALVGHISWTLSQSKHHDGIDMCNLDTAVISMMHLYQACRKTGIVKPWEDLEFIIAQQDPKALKVELAGPTSLQPMLHAAKCFGILLGANRIEHNKSRRKSIGQDGRAKLPSFPFVLNRMPKMKNTSEFDDTLAQHIELHGGLQNQVMRTAIYHYANKVLASNPEINEDGEPTHLLSSVQVLNVLRKGLVKEAMGTYFDYHGFLATVYQILADIQRLWASRSTSAPAQGCLPHELVDEILWDAANAEKGKKPSSGLNIAGIVLNNAVLQIGSARVKRARWCCTGQVEENASRPQSSSTSQDAAITAESNTSSVEDAFAGMKVTMKGTKLDIKSPMITQAETEWRTETQKLISEKATMISSGAGAEEMAAWEERMKARKQELAALLGNF